MNPERSARVSVDQLKADLKKGFFQVSNQDEFGHSESQKIRRQKWENRGTRVQHHVQAWLRRVLSGGIKHHPHFSGLFWC